MQHARDVYIVDVVRSAIANGRNDQGTLHRVHPVTLLANVLESLIVRQQQAGPLSSQQQQMKLELAHHIDDVICGVVTPVRQQGANIARLALLKANFPVHVPGVQLNRKCGSSQQAIHFASQAIAAGDYELAIACGVECMSQCPMRLDTDEKMWQGKAGYVKLRTTSRANNY